MATLTLRLDEFGWDAVTAVAGEYGMTVGEFVSAGCRRASADGAGPPPAFIPESAGTERPVELDLDARELEALERQAGAADVELATLVRHNVLWLLAEIDAGHVSADLAGAGSAHSDDEAA